MMRQMLMAGGLRCSPFRCRWQGGSDEEVGEEVVEQLPSVRG